jgi:hypothetical protein
VPYYLGIVREVPGSRAMTAGPYAFHAARSPRMRGIFLPRKKPAEAGLFDALGV